MHKNNLSLEQDCAWAIPTFDKPGNEKEIGLFEEFLASDDFEDESDD